VAGHGRWDGAPPEPLTPAATSFFERPARPAAGGFRVMAVSPPAGPLAFVCEWPLRGIVETRAEIDAAPILEAAAVVP
jgi:hypothetical protein